MIRIADRRLQWQVAAIVSQLLDKVGRAASEILNAAIDFAHVDLTGSEQTPEQHRRLAPFFEQKEDDRERTDPVDPT